jgi:hypothetical protein
MPAQPVGGGGVYGGAARLQVPALAQSLAPQMASNIGPMGSACARRASERDANSGPEVGPTSAFYSCVPTGTHGPTGIFFANITPFSLQAPSPESSFYKRGASSVWIFPERGDIQTLNEAS